MAESSLVHRLDLVLDLTVLRGLDGEPPRWQREGNFTEMLSALMND
jgi:hypothetical protein